MNHSEALDDNALKERSRGIVASVNQRRNDLTSIVAGLVFLTVSLSSDETY